jgi:uncharacterized protein (UPF0548 family)
VGVGLLRTVDLGRLASAPFTYPEVGATRDDRFPVGYPAAERSGVVGSGRAAFERAVDAVFDWRAQRGVGLRVRASGSPRTPGTVVVLTAGLPRFGYDMPCRVVWAQTHGDARGFGYGSLPGHPESGEESFVVSIDADGEVVFRTRVFSRLASPLARLGGPASRAVQFAALDRYVTAVTAAGREPVDRG